MRSPSPGVETPWTPPYGTAGSTERTRRKGQAAELVLLLDVLDAAGFASEEAPLDDADDVEDDEEPDVEDDDEEDAGELLDDAPRLSLR
jgi:hypothetical protein